MPSQQDGLPTYEVSLGLCHLRSIMDQSSCAEPRFQNSHGRRATRGHLARTLNFGRTEGSSP